MILVNYRENIIKKKKENISEFPVFFKIKIRDNGSQTTLLAKVTTIIYKCKMFFTTKVYKNIKTFRKKLNKII